VTDRSFRLRPPTVNRPRPHATTGHRALGLVLVALLLLAACGKEEEATPTPAATTAPPVTAVSTIGSATPGSASGLTVAELADRIAAAWPAVMTYRTVTTTVAQTPAGSPVAGPSPVAGGPVVSETIDEFVLPDRKRRLARAGDALQYELVVVDGRIYARGPQAPGLNPSRPNPDAWVEVAPATLETATAHAEDYGNLFAPVTAPYSRLSPEKRARDAVPLGQIAIDGRACTSYRIADTTLTGERIEIVLALGPDDLPCAIETHAGGQVTTTVFTYNMPLTIEAPAAATPLAAGP
jgi:hypothetical protein